MSTLLLVNGPNLNLLGSREPEVYGRGTLSEVEADMSRRAEELGHNLLCCQDNQEGVLVNRIQTAKADGVEFIIANFGAFTHTSIALRDALLAVAIPFIEVHLTNVYARESFRQHSYFSDIAVGVIVGLGPIGYGLALHAADQQLRTPAPVRT